MKTSKITILSPPEKKLYFAADKFVAEPKEFEKDGLTGHTWEVHNLPQIDPESLMPGFYETVPYLQVSTFETWDETARWVADLVSEQFESSPAIKQAVLDTIKGLDTDEEKINALYQKMVSDIRYEALSLDSHAYKPFKASETFDRKYGDCKDTACLFVTMLREAGIEAGFALVRVRDSGKVNTKVPSMKIFNHAITYVPDKNGGGIFYDGTARYCGAEEKPFMDEGALAFVVDRNGTGRLIEEIPFSAPMDNVDDNTLEITLNTDGSATVVMESKITGKEAGDFRNTYQEGANRQRYFEQTMNRYFGTITVKTLEFSDLSEYNKPVLLKAEFTTPNFARIDGPKISFAPAVFSLDLADKYASLEKREYEIVLDSYPIAYPKKSIHSMTFNIPAGYELSKLPEESQFQSDFGQYKLVTDRVAPVKFIVKTEFTVTLLRINNKQYPAFRTFCADVDRIEKEDAVIEKP
ncbi:MAG: transglutaminase domain-containing protein [Planctomycetes bacterium]|nr:transglutaminase domain-containing protein [Planctomycetota bacterium]